MGYYGNNMGTSTLINEASPTKMVVSSGFNGHMMDLMMGSMNISIAAPKKIETI